jgi:hypothetical protein
MIKSVHIPVFCDSKEARGGALLTLKTIRVGFPTVPITVHWMGDDVEVLEELKNQDVAALKFWSGLKRNDQLIKLLVGTEKNGFAVVDSDVVFFKNCENFQTNELIAGEFIPTFHCPIANAMTHSRLHTAFFVVPDPAKLREVISKVYHPAFPKFCPFDPFSPVTLFLDRKPLFYDSCSVLYHAVGGESFNEDMLNRFEHVYSGSYAHKLPWPHAKFINEVYTDPCKARGFRMVMDNFFTERKAAIS